MQSLIHKKRDLQKIRAMLIAQSEQIRRGFWQLVEKILEQEGLDEVDTRRVFKDHYYHKMITSHRPDFNPLFP